MLNKLLIFLFCFLFTNVIANAQFQNIAILPQEKLWSVGFRTGISNQNSVYYEDYDINRTFNYNQIFANVLLGTNQNWMLETSIGFVHTSASFDYWTPHYHNTSNHYQLYKFDNKSVLRYNFFKN